MLRINLSDDNLEEKAAISTEKLDEIKPEPLTKETTDLITAIKKNNLESALIAIKANANVNAIVQEKNNKETPLLLAIKQLNIKMIQLLLENGADPNPHLFKTPSTLSALEALLMIISNIHCEALLELREKHTPEIFKKLHLNIKVSRPIHFSEQHVLVFEKILNLLVSYGLTAPAQWHKDVAKDFRELREAHSYELEAREKKQLLSIAIDTTLANPSGLVEENNSFIKKTLKKGMIKTIGPVVSWLAKRQAAIPQPSPENLADWVHTEQNIRATLDDAIDAVQLEKNNILATYEQNLRPIFSKNIKATSLINIILDYLNHPIEFSQRVIAKRAEAKQTFFFWQHTKPIQTLSEEKKHVFTESIKLGIGLSFLAQPGSGLNPIVTEESKHEPALDVGQIISLINEYATPSEEEVAKKLRKK